MSNRWGILASCLLLLSFLLASCYLVSGERVEETPLVDLEQGVYAVQFVSSDGQGLRTIDTGIPTAPFVVQVTAETAEGEMTVQVLSGGESIITVTARPDMPDSRQVTVRADPEGKLTLRITAIEARGGAYTVRYRLAAPLTPTPTPTVTPKPTAQPGP
jgi:uncharacterized protein (DUF2141 family)